MADLKQILSSENIYSGQVNINGVNCTVGYIKKFKWTWFATQLNTFIIIGETDQPINKAVIENFSSACLNYALANNKGWPRGLQSGVGSIAILMGNNIEGDAIYFAENSSKKHFSAFEIPVLLDLEKRLVYKYKSTPIWGKIYFSYFTQTINWLISKL